MGRLALYYAMRELTEIILEWLNNNPTTKFLVSRTMICNQECALDLPPGQHWDTCAAFKKVDAVNHPKHYTSHPSGVECIDITEHMTFCLGNAIKYIWRADEKENAIEDLQKAVFYLNREINLRQKRQKASLSP